MRLKKTSKMLFDLQQALQQQQFFAMYSRFLRQDVVFDTGPLFLYLVGSFDSKEGTRLLDLFHYTLDDYQLLLKIIHLFKKDQTHFVITPHIFHELIRHVQIDIETIYSDRVALQQLLEKLKEFLHTPLQQMQEYPTGKDLIMDHASFLFQWEVGDISLDVVSSLHKNCTILLTDDKKFTKVYAARDDFLLISFQDIKHNAYL